MMPSASSLELRIKNKAAAQATFDEDYNVPDVKPDISTWTVEKPDGTKITIQVNKKDANKY